MNIEPDTHGVDPVTLTVIGCGDAFGTAGRLQPCFLVEYQETRLLIDCGASALLGLRARGVAPGSVAAVLVSHLHGDHFGGLPFFVVDALYSARRDAPLLVAGPSGTASRVMGALDVFYPGARARFDATPVLVFQELEASYEATVFGVQVTAFSVLHSSGAPAFAFRINVGGRIIAYSGDTAWTDTLIHASRDADLFICECSTFDRPVSMHISYRDLEIARNRITAKRILLTHLGPDMFSHLDEVALDVARDALQISL